MPDLDSPCVRPGPAPRDARLAGPAGVNPRMLWLVGLTGLLALAATPGIAQGVPRPGHPAAADTTPFVATPQWDPDRYLSSRTPLEFTLTHPLEAGEHVALMVGPMDVSSVVAVRGLRITYVPDVARLPAGESDVVAYVVTTGGTWHELARARVRVRTSAGFDGSARDIVADLTSAGALATQQSAGGGAARGAYQDLTLRLGVNGQGTRNGWKVTAQSNALAASRKEQRLRWNDRGPDAQRLDLTDYRLQLEGPSLRASVGNLSAGLNRHLLNGFASRGVSVGAQLRRAVTLDAAMLNGTNAVGWENMVGIGEPDHRMASASLALELVPSRPGALHVDLSGLDGSILPRTGVNQGAVTDAETSRGFGVQWNLSDAAQRIRFAGGLARSRFTNPRDLTLGDTSVVPVRAEARTARFGELALQVLPERVRLGHTRVALGTVLRHERVDPLYRSVGTSVGADRQDDAAEFTGTLGALALQGTAARGRDNLGRVASILTTRTERRGVNLAAPLAALLGLAPRAWLPAATFAWDRTTQVGDGIPVNGDFAASHVPAQWNYARAASLSWTLPHATLAWRWNAAVQDNRQPGRERSDLRSRVHAVSFGLTGWPTVTPSVEGSVERQDFAETSTQQRTTRVGAGVQAIVRRTIGMTGNVSRTWTFDPFAQRRLRQVEMQGEVSRAFSLPGQGDGTRGRVFVRYARTRARFLLAVPDPTLAARLTWNLHAGSSFRLF